MALAGENGFSGVLSPHHEGISISFPGQMAGPGVGVGFGWSRGGWEEQGRSLGPAGTSLALGDKADSPQSCRHCHHSFLLRTLPHGSGKTH